MAISFDQIPANLRVPFVFVEINSAGPSGDAEMPYRALVVGQQLATAEQAALTPVRVTSAAQGATLFGAGSMLAQALAAFIKNDPFTELYAVGVEDASAGVKSTGSVALTGAATEAGTLRLYIGGRRISVGVSSGQQASAVATALASAINAETDSPAAAAAESGTVTLTARHKGEAGNGIDLRLNYYTGEATPAGLSATITAMHGGTGNPDVDDLLAALGDTQYHVIAWPWTDAASLTAVEDFLEERWGPTKMIDGVAIASATGTHGALGTLGDSRNSKHLCLMHAHGTPTTTWEVAAATAAVASFYGQIDPARPFQTLPLKGVLPPAEADRFTMTEQNLLLYDGISTFTVDAGGVVRVQRLITTYKTSANGAEDESYLDLCSPLTLSYLRYSWRNWIMLKFPRHKLADDGTNYGPGQAIITPKVGKAEAIAWARRMETRGLMENIDEFAATLICERNADDKNRLDFMLPANLVNQFVVGGVQMNFYL